ncbi:MAG TPA: hypothetical protein VFT00_09620 [Nocardioides sp.]|nr:hypothetical protein [Nocardioides sp.]
MLDTVRRRHPDADVVVLPPEPSPVPTPAVDDQGVAATIDLVRRLATSLWAHVADAPADPPVDPDFGPLCGTVVVRSRHSASIPDRPHLLADLRDDLQGDGWHFRRPCGAVERLVGERDGVELRGIYAAGSGLLLVTLTSAALFVGADRARSVVRH